VKCLNLGCGQRIHPDWVNLDLRPSAPGVQEWDLKRELPFPEASFDVVYHSHVLEHFPHSSGLQFLERCRRVLRPDGIIRVAVPDLEMITRLYLSALEKVLAGDDKARSAYDWAVIEMYDQTVRDRSGGEMAEFVRKASPPELELVKVRLGGELHPMLNTRDAPSKPRARDKRLLRLGRRLRRAALRTLLGSDGFAAYDHGKFRRSGEIHQWMYDRYSLGRALMHAGFSRPQQVGPAESAIPRWVEYHLDTERDGSTYKPDSLYMEATRP
jgi:SAM-dependent methyltransferase